MPEFRSRVIFEPPRRKGNHLSSVKILILNEWYSHNSQKRPGLVASFLLERSHQTHVASLHPKLPPTFVEWTGIHVDHRWIQQYDQKYPNKAGRLIWLYQLSKISISYLEIPNAIPIGPEVVQKKATRERVSRLKSTTTSAGLRRNVWRTGLVMWAPTQMWVEGARASINDVAWRINVGRRPGNKIRLWYLGSVQRNLEGSWSTMTNLLVKVAQIVGRWWTWNQRGNRQMLRYLRRYQYIRRCRIVILRRWSLSEIIREARMLMNFRSWTRLHRL